MVLGQLPSGESSWLGVGKCCAGDSLLIQPSVYGGTFGLVHSDLPTFGITPIVVDPSDPSSWEAHLAPSTKASVQSSPPRRTPDSIALAAGPDSL